MFSWMASLNPSVLLKDDEECYCVVPNITMLHNNLMKGWEHLVNWRKHMNEDGGNQDTNMIEIVI